MTSPLWPTISLDVSLEVKRIFSLTIASSIFLPVVASKAIADIVNFPLPLTIVCDDLIDTDTGLDAGNDFVDFWDGISQDITSFFMIEEVELLVLLLAGTFLNTLFFYLCVRRLADSIKIVKQVNWNQTRLFSEMFL